MTSQAIETKRSQSKLKAHRTNLPPARIHRQEIDPLQVIDENEGRLNFDRAAIWDIQFCGSREGY
jgi:hypothetical protein